MRVVSLFTGGGGLDLGLEAAGFEVAVAVENDSDSVRTIRANRDWPLIPKAIEDVSSGNILRTARVEPGEIDLVTGGPPCQPFSKLAYWASGDSPRLSDPRSRTLGHFFRIVGDLLPRAFLLENVPGFSYNSKSEGMRAVIQETRTINEVTGQDYKLSIQLINAVEFGVPQDRERLFIVGIRDGSKFVFPRRSHSSPTVEGRDQLSFEHLEPYLTAWDAIGDLEVDQSEYDLSPRGKFADLLPSIPEGKNYQFHTPRGSGLPLFGWRTRYWHFLLKLAKGKPSWTITANPAYGTGPYHWDNRRLAPRELCRLQTFPDDYHVQGSLDSIQRQVGNAVPSALAEKVGYELRAQVFGEEPVLRQKMPTLLPKPRRPIPPPNTPAIVPSKYEARVSDHPPHPGAGKGPGARSRQEDRLPQHPTLPGFADF